MDAVLQLGFPSYQVALGSVKLTKLDSYFPFTVTKDHNKSNLRETVLTSPPSLRLWLIMVESFHGIYGQEAERDEVRLWASRMDGDFLSPRAEGLPYYIAPS